MKTWKKSESRTYYKYEGDIYEYYKDKDYFLKATGWESGEDRRVPRSKIDANKLVYINPEKARFMINEYWNTGVRTWIYNGVQYSNKGEFPRDYDKVPNHEFTRKSYFGYTSTHTETYKLVWHQGHLFWCEPYNYYPIVTLFQFEDINKFNYRTFIKWTNIKNCRPVVNSEGQFI